jgi:hypothetical protein
MKTPRLLLLVIASSLAACSGRSRSNSSTSARSNPLSSNGVNATLRVQSDWKAGYCADVTLENTSAAAVTWWTVVVDLHQSTLTDLWNGTVSTSGSQITVTPTGGTATIAAGGSLNAFGFCGSATGSTYLPELISIAVVGGGGGGTSDFALSANPAGGTLPQGSSGASTITIDRSGYTGSVALAVSGLPAGVTATLEPATTTGTTSTLAVEVSSSAGRGTSMVTVTGTGGGITRTVQLSLTVSGNGTSDFALSANPTGGTLPQGSSGSSTITIDRSGYTGSVALAVSSLPSGATATLEPATTTGTTSALTVAVSSSAAPGTSTLTVTGTGGGLTRTVQLALTVSGGTARHQAPYPPVDASSCGSWALTDNVCCARYCADDSRSEGCGGCGGDASPLCVTVNAKACKSGEWPEVHSVSDAEPWHFSRSTHYGLTQGGACGFGLYGLCTSNAAFNDANLGAQCAAFCKAYPTLCADPAGTTLRGNFAAPPGNYYTQFWSSLAGDRDNYLSCGECFEVVRTKKDGTDYQPGEAGYTLPVTLQITDSCPCSANSKWCCGSGRDHCGEISDFKYGCPLQPGPPDPPADHDPLPNESIHLDLSDIAMARLQTGSPGGSMVDGVIPTRYRRVPCPVVGNVYVWLRSGAGPYWFSLSIVNSAGPGSTAKVEAQLPSGAWIALVHDQNYTSSRPQERYGAWVMPQGAGPLALPVPLRISDPSGKSITTTIKAWAPADASQTEMYYIDTGAQF